MPYLYMSFPTKQSYNQWLFCGKSPATKGILCFFATLYHRRGGFVRSWCVCVCVCRGGERGGEGLRGDQVMASAGLSSLIAAHNLSISSHSCKYFSNVSFPVNSLHRHRLVRIPGILTVFARELRSSHARTLWRETFPAKILRCQLSRQHPTRKSTC